MPLIKLRQASEPQLFYLDRSREQSKVSIIRHILVKSFHVESHHSGLYDNQNTLPLLRSLEEFEIKISFLFSVFRL